MNTTAEDRSLLEIPTLLVDKLVNGNIFVIFLPAKVTCSNAAHKSGCDTAGKNELA